MPVKKEDDLKTTSVIKIIEGDITALDTDAIVNAANTAGWRGLWYHPFCGRAGTCRRMPVACTLPDRRSPDNTGI